MFKVCITSLLPPNMCSFQSGNAPSSQVQQTVVTGMCLPLPTRQAVRVNGPGRQCQVAFKTIADEDSTRCNRHHNSDLLPNTRILPDVISTIIVPINCRMQESCPKLSKTLLITTTLPVLDTAISAWQCQTWIFQLNVT